MLMDMFFELLPVRRKRRVHFNDFMADVQDRIQKHRQARKEGTVKEDDPIPPVARAMAEEAWVLCFDEFSVTDIADAMILSRLFSALFAQWRGAGRHLQRRAATISIATGSTASFSCPSSACWNGTPMCSRWMPTPTTGWKTRPHAGLSDAAAPAADRSSTRPGRR